jgi:hypothetical protein
MARWRLSLGVEQPVLIFRATRWGATSLNRSGRGAPELRQRVSIGDRGDVLDHGAHGARPFPDGSGDPLQ